MKKTIKPSKRYSLIKNIKRTLQINWQIDKLGVISYLVLIIIQVTTNISAVYFGSRIIGELTKFIQNQSIDRNRLYIFLALVSLSILIEQVAWRFISFNERKSWIKWYVRMTIDVNESVSKLDMETHHNPAFEKKLQKITQNYQHTPQNFANNIFQLIHSLLRLVSTFFVVATFAPLVILLMVLALIPGYLAENKYSKLKWNLWDEKGDKNMLAYRTTYYLLDKNKLQETKIFQTSKFLLDLLRKLFNGFYDRQLIALKKTQSTMILSLIVETAVSAGINLWLIFKVLSNNLSIANYSFYSGIIFEFGSSLGHIAHSLNYIYDNNTYMKDLYGLFDLNPSQSTIENPIKLPKDTDLTITFNNVSFVYPESKKQILKNFNLTINTNDSIALVGQNGAGKTTIIKLLLRFYKPTTGTITVNGINLNEIDINDYYNRIGVLFQDFNDYPFSVRDNIAMGRVSNFNNNPKIKEAARLANADTFIQEYPNKYNQILEIAFKDGIEPSGGQWQRIALARALFRNAELLILDEPTAAIDAKSEYEIFKTLERHSQDKTTIIISHRFSTVRKAKTIYVMEGGHIIEQGSHDELMKHKNGLYKEMFDKQAEGYK